ncbi:hypothetical protein ZIOFF_044948 [Zingiber officinale]|uniref:RRM domain-containing protein n=1 Tax=Zingiber officinale TaxID=94328 RepID=A0A8J5G238_ZINOF|nr:hypothetical protein ZIOFF_044948 [Zingiber officinale]
MSTMEWTDRVLEGTKYFLCSSTVLKARWLRGGERCCQGENILALGIVGSDFGDDGASEMGKSSKKTNVEVAPAVPAVSAKPGKKGKRDAEVTLEKEGSAKKQKKEIENAVPKGDIRNLKKALKNAPLKKKPETSSSEDDSSSDSEEEPVKTVPASDKKAAVATKNGSFAAVTKKGKESSSSESDSDEDEVSFYCDIVLNRLMQFLILKDDSDESDVAPQLKKSKIMDSVPSAKTKPVAKIVKKESSSSEEDEDDSSEESSDDEPSKQQQAKKDSVPSSKTKPVTKIVKKESSSSEEDEDDSSEESSDDEPSKQQQAKKDSVPSAKTKPVAKIVKKESSSSEEDEDDSSEESSDDEPSKQQQAKKVNLDFLSFQPSMFMHIDSVSSSKTKPVAKTVKKESSSSEEDEDDSAEESSDDEPSKQQQIKKVIQASKKSNSSDSSEESSDEESEDEEPLKTPKKDNDVEMKDASVVSAEKQTATKSEKKTSGQTDFSFLYYLIIVTTQNQAPGSRTLFIGNLSYDVGQDDVAEFFKTAGEVVDVRLATAEDGSFKGFGHVEFATEEDAKKALELNGNELFGRGVRLDVARERGSYTPQSGKDNYQKGSKGQSQTIFVKGFDRSLEEDQVRSSLEEHFGSCGDITRISVPKDYETGAPKGIAYIDFKDQESFNKAYELNGSDLGGYSLTVDEAKPRTDNRDGGWSGGRDGGGRSGGRFGGRDGGRRGGRGDRGRGRDFGGRGRGRGRGGAPFRPQSAGTASTGKKTTFGDD